MITKVCAKCKEEKQSNEFRTDARYKNNLFSYCKPCEKSYYLETAERARRLRISRYHRNADKARKDSRDWYHSNKERAAEVRRVWAKNNKGKSNAIKKKYKAAKINAVPCWLTELDELIINEYYSRAASMSNNIKYHVDHIVPLQGKTVSGLHVPWNLQIMEASANISKSNKMWLQYTP